MKCRARLPDGSSQRSFQLYNYTDDSILLIAPCDNKPCLHQLRVCRKCDGPCAEEHRTPRKRMIRTYEELIVKEIITCTCLLQSALRCSFAGRVILGLTGIPSRESGQSPFMIPSVYCLACVLLGPFCALTMTSRQLLSICSAMECSMSRSCLIACT